MSVKTRKSRIKLTESINEKLDAMVEENSTDVYKPKKNEDITETFLELVGDEVFFGNDDYQKEEIQKSKIHQKTKKQKNNSKVKDKLVNGILLLFVTFGFLGFISIILLINK